MKKLLTLTALLGLSFFSVHGKLWLDPLDNQMWVWPMNDDINIVEYRGYLDMLRNIRQNMRAINRFVSDIEIIRQCVHLGISVGTPTSLRFAEDIQNNKIYYLNGTCAGTIIEIV